MGTSLTFTSNIFSTGTLFATASAATASGYIVTTTATPYDVLGGTVSYDRRLYSLSCYNTGPAQTLTVSIWDGTKNAQIFLISAAIGSTTPTVTDLFNSANIASLFQRQKDANGVTYFNIPTNYSIRCAYSAALTGPQLLTFLAVGETYE
jgi:hypothetical protein